MDKQARICMIFLLLISPGIANAGSEEINFNDSIEKLNSISVDSTYAKFATKISNLYVKEGKAGEGIIYLEKQIQSVPNGSDKHQILFILLAKAHYQQRDYERSLLLIDSALMAKAEFNPVNAVRLWRLKAQNYFRTEAFGKSIESYKQSLALLVNQNDSSQMDDVMSAISSCYYAIDNLPQALYYVQEAWKISVQTDDMESRSRILNTLGNINKELGNMEEAKKNYEECFSVAEKTDDYEGMILSNSSLALIEMYKKNFDEALRLIWKAIDYSTEYNVPNFIGGLYVNLARIKTDQGKISEAIEYYMEAVSLSEKRGDRNKAALAYANIAFIHTDEKQYEKSNEFLRNAFPFAEETGDLDLLREIAGGFYDNYKGLGNHKEALKYHELYTTYSDSVMNDEKARELNNLKTTFAVEEKEKELTLKAEKEKILSDAEIKKQKLIRNFSVAGGLLLLVLAIFIFQRYRERHRSSLLLAEKSKTIEKAYTDLKSMQEELVETEKQRESQNTRVRIARDIHDDIGSGLTKITLLSDIVRKKISQPEVSDSLSKIASYSKGVTASLSEIVWAINPVHDNVSSLVAYMKNTAGHLLEDSGINYRLNFPSAEMNVSIHPEVKRNIFLVMKEALNNAFKYSAAKNITVDFNIEGDQFLLKIADDGIGFDPNVMRTSGTGNGLRNMQLRMEQHHNSLRVISSAGNGCQVIAEGKLI